MAGSILLKTAAVFGLGSLLVSGCIDRGNVVPPEVAAVENRLLPERNVTDAEKQKLAVKTGGDGQEVVAFTLAQAVDRAVQYNIQMLNIYDQYPIAESNLEGAKSEFWVEYSPSVSGTILGEDTAEGRRYRFNLTKKFTPGTISDIEISATEFDDSKEARIRFSLDQPLLRGAGKLVVTNNLVTARRNIAIVLRGIELSKEELAFEVISSYYDIIREREIVRLNEKSVQRMTTLRDMSSANLDVHKNTPEEKAAKLDLFRAEVQLAQAEDNLVEAEQSHGDALDNLKLLMGYSNDVRIDIATDTDIPYEDYEELKINEVSAINTALKNRLDYREAWDRIHDARRNEKVAKNNLLPDLNLVVGHAFSDEGANYSDAFAFDDSSWFIGFSTSTDIRRTSERASYTQARIETRNVKRSFDLLRDQIIREVRRNIRRLEKNYNRIKIQEHARKQARVQFELTRFLYKEGRKKPDGGDAGISSLDLTQAEEDLTLAETSYIFAVTDYLTAQARLKKTMGTLTEKNPEVFKMGYFDK